MSTSTASGFLHAFVLDGKGGARSIDWAGVESWTASDGDLWLALDYSIADAAAWLETRSGIDPPTYEALIQGDPRPRAVPHDDNLMLIVRGINQNLDATPEDMISVRAWVEPNRVITLRHRISRSLESIAADIQRGKGPRDAADVTATLVERIVEHVTTRVDSLGDEISAAEERIIEETRGELRGQLADYRRRAIALRRFLAPQREALTKLSTISLSWLDEAHRERVAESADRMTRTVEELDAARDRAAVTQEELSSRQTEMTNQRLYVPSMITAVFLPLGFVCALLGVNVGGVPFRDDNWAFWALVAVFGGGVGIQLYLFRKKGWL
ncbi:MAG: zinc transporter ZntB [Kofleriaceae bacterium]